MEDSTLFFCIYFFENDHTNYGFFFFYVIILLLEMQKSVTFQTRNNFDKWFPIICSLIRCEIKERRIQAEIWWTRTGILCEEDSS